MGNQFNYNDRELSGKLLEIIFVIILENEEEITKRHFLSHQYPKSFKTKNY